MRSYFKGYRSPDFKTLIVDVPPGTEFFENFDVIAIEHTPRLNIPVIHNFFTGIDQWLGFGPDGFDVPIYGPVGGLTLANFIYNIQPYDEHPKN